MTLPELSFWIFSLEMCEKTSTHIFYIPTPEHMEKVTKLFTIFYQKHLNFFFVHKKKRNFVTY